MTHSRTVSITTGAIGLAGAGLALLRSYLEAAAAPPGAESMRWFTIVWGGSAAVSAIWMAVSLARRDGREIFCPLVVIAFCCAFTAHGAMTASTSFDIASLERPDGLAVILLAAHAGVLAWVLGVRVSSEADRGLLLLLLFHALNRDLYLAQADLIAMFTGLVVIRAVLEDRGRLVLPPRWILAPLAVFLVWVSVSIALATEPARALSAAAYLFACASAWVLIAARPRDHERFPVQALSVLVVASCLVLLVAGLQLFGVASVLGLSATLSTRLGVLYQHPNMLGPYLATMALLSVALRPLVRGRMLRWLLGLHTIVCLGGLWLTDSRTAFVGFLCGGTVLVASAVWRRVTLPRREILLAVAGLIAVALLASTRADVLMDGTRITRALEFRRAAWSYAWTSIGDHPVFGIGPDTFPTLQDPAEGTRFSHTVSVPHPHNQLLYVAQSSGLPALAALLVLIGGYVFIALRILRSGNDREKQLATACLAGSVTLLVCGLFDDSQSFTTLVSRPEWVFLGVASAIAAPRVAGARSGPGFGIAVVALLCFFYLGVRPAAAQALADRAAAAQRAGQWDEAAEDAALALRADPYLGSALESLIVCEMRRGNPGVALEHAEAAGRRSPTNANLQLKIGSLRQQRGDVPGAVAAFGRAVDLGRGDGNRAHYCRALIQALALSGAATETREALEESIRIDAQVLSLLRFEQRPGGELILPVTGAAPLDLKSVLQDLRHQALADAAGAERVDRYRWWNLYFAFRGRFDELAEVVLDDIERLFADFASEQAAVAYQRGLLAEERSLDDEARSWLERAVAIGDPTNPSAERLHRLHLGRVSSRDASARPEEPRAVLGELSDFRIETESFVAVLEDLLAALQETHDASARVEPLEKLAFFTVEPRMKAQLRLDIASALSAAGDPSAAEGEVIRALRILWEAERSAKLQIDKDPAARASLQRAGRLLSATGRALGLTPPEAKRRLLEATGFLERAPVAELLLRSFTGEPLSVPRRSPGLPQRPPGAR